MKIPKAVEDALDGVTDNKYAKLLREPAVTVHQFADLLGVSILRAKQIIFLRSGNVLTKWRDPETGEVMLVTDGVVTYLERARDIEEETERKKNGDAPPTSPYADGPAAYSVSEAASMLGEDEGYVREAVHLGRIPGPPVARGSDVLVSGPWLRRKADERRRAKVSKDAEASQKASLESPVWIPLEEGAKQLGMDERYLRRLGYGNFRGLVTQRVNGKACIANNAAFKLLVDARERRRAER